jgi:hypothetical protein
MKISTILFTSLFVFLLSFSNVSIFAAEVKGNNVRYVNARWEEGKEKKVSFTKQSNNNQWEEHNQWNDRRYLWEQINHDEWSVYLKMGVDKAQIDLFKQKIIFERNGVKEVADIIDKKD